MALLATLLVASAAAAGAAPASLPRFTIAAADLRSAGVAHGQQAKPQIDSFLQLDEIVAAASWAASGSGADLLASLVAQAHAAYPDLVEEIEGIAEGSKNDVDAIWVGNLIAELEAAMYEAGAEEASFALRRRTRKGAGHCSDVMAVDSEDGSVWHGHNEDWSQDFAPLLYLVNYIPTGNATFTPVGGIVYPGQTPGFAIAYTPSLWTTQNSLFPEGVNATGNCLVGAGRSALEGGKGDGPATADLYGLPGQAYGSNINIVAYGSDAYAAGVEVAGAANLATTTVAGGNYTHFNEYKFMTVPDDGDGGSSFDRQAAADAHKAPKSRADVLAILGDTSDPEYPIYNAHTMFTVLFNSITGNVQLWTGRNPSEGEPDFESRLEDLVYGGAKFGLAATGASCGGFYTDPNHYKGRESFAGTRMVSDEIGDAASDTLTLVGSDDGVAFWTLAGAWTDQATGKLTVDFSPKGGPADLQGTYGCDESSCGEGNCKITWQDGSAWSKSETPETIGEEGSTPEPCQEGLGCGDIGCVTECRRGPCGPSTCVCP